MQVIDVTWKPQPKREPRRPRVWSQIAKEAPLEPTASSVPTTSGARSKPSAEISTSVQDEPIAKQFEYLDHTADVQIHSWGKTLEEAFAQAAIGMFGYMTDLNLLQNKKQVDIKAEGHDAESLLYNFLDECLYQFGGDGFMMRKVVVDKIDRGEWKIWAKGSGEEFDNNRHTQGTEVKAITYSNLQVKEKNEETGMAEVFVIVDI